ncbi:hypothetical protein GCM10022254_13340 [Actinomadura meridiana]|uniref:Recombination endonuclease VII n=1 Tax=Actinomadura meridiana TaxID=559626 RepID=A0ABP8BUX7_9ACTN
MGEMDKVSLMLSKRCRDCGEIKPATAFWRLKSSKDGLAYYCKACFGLRNSRSYRSKQKSLGKDTREYRRYSDVPKGMKYCARCKETKSINEFGRNRAESSGLTSYCRPCHSAAMAEIRRRNHGSERNFFLKRRYGLTEGRVDQMIAEQGGVCVICLRAEPKHVDHDHLTGLVRRILCFKCNGGLGQFEDNPERLRLAAEYLELEGSQARRLMLERGAPVFVGRTHLTESEWRARPRQTSPREQHRLGRYGIDDEGVEWLRKTQVGLCAVCFDLPAEQIDHDHKTGAVRGIACLGCNAGMGQLLDDPIALRRAADYLMGALVKTVPTPDGGTRLSFTVPDVDPAKVAPGGWTARWEADGRHRKANPELGKPLWITYGTGR